MTESKEKLRNAQAQQRDFINQTGLTRDYPRERVTSFANFKEKTLKSTEKLTNSEKNDILSLKNSTDFDSLSATLKSKYSIDMDDAIKELNFDSVLESLNGFEAMAKEYPDIAKAVKTIKTNDMGVMACDGDSILFNPVYFGDDDKLKNICDKCGKTGEWVSNASKGSCMVHESTHMLESVLVEKNAIYKTEAEKTLAWNTGKEAENIIRQASNELKKSDVGKSMIKPFLQEGYEKEDWNMYAEVEKSDKIHEGFMGIFSGSISEYALTDYSECLAEAFADVFANGEKASPFSKKIKEIATKVYKGG